MKTINTPFVCVHVGVGCFGAATILIAQHKPQQMFTVLRLVDLEMLSVKQLDEVQNEMRLSNLFQHQNIAGYFCSFVVGPKLWAVQELMHYGMFVAGSATCSVCV